MFSELIKRHKLSIAFVGDIALFVLSILAIIYLRYGIDEFQTRFDMHLEPFIIVLILWFTIFYISDLYTYSAFGNIIEISKRIIVSILISFSITITIFYIFSRFFELTPKANLVLLAILFCLLDILWRYILRKIFIRQKYQSNVLMLTESPLIEEIVEHTKRNPQLGYSFVFFDNTRASLEETIRKNMITQVVIDGKTLEDNDITKKLYKILSKQIEITTLTEFYESLFRCIPLLEIEEGWFIREITKNKRIYESMKRLVEILLVVTTLPITLPLGIIISLSVIIFSKGSIIYHQERIGRNNVPFTLYKFRTMTEGIDGPLWTSENDARITKIGKFLRNTHIDELPQLWNVIKGDISFVGPRPERSKLVKVYEIIPFYETRHLIKPGITGWAQLNFKPSVSPEEAKKKIQFDLYYIKNRSFILDLFIILKTARAVFTDAN